MRRSRWIKPAQHSPQRLGGGALICAAYRRELATEAERLPPCEKASVPIAGHANGLAKLRGQHHGTPYTGIGDAL
jgi:hypothetical protein